MYDQQKEGAISYCDPTNGVKLIDIWGVGLSLPGTAVVWDGLMCWAQSQSALIRCTQEECRVGAIVMLECNVVHGRLIDDLPPRGIYQRDEFTMLMCEFLYYQTR